MRNLPGLFRSSVQRICAATNRLAPLVAALVVFFCGLSVHAQTGSAAVSAVLGPAAPYYTDDVTATVSVTAASSPVPTGSITWNTDSGGQQTASLVNGVARIELKFFAPGAHTFHYSYGGDGTYAPVASQSLGFTVKDRAFSIIGSEYQYFATSISNGTTFTAALDSKSNVYLPAPATNSLAKLDPQGNVSTVAVTGLSRPNGIVVDTSDNIYLADSGNARIVEISASGTQTVVPITGLIDPLSLAFDPAKQNLYITDQGNGSVTVYNLAAQTQTSFMTGEVLYGIAVDATGNVYYTGATSAFSGDGQLYRRDPSGNTITLFTGLDNPQGLLIGPQGELYIESAIGLFVLDAQSHLSQLTFVTSLSRPVQGYILPGNIAMDRRGNIYRPSANDIFVRGKSADAGPAVYDPSFGHSFYVYYQVSYQETITSVTTVSGSPAANLQNYVPTPAYSPASVPFLYFNELFNVIGYAGPWSSYLTVTTSDGKQDTPIVYGSGLAASFAVAPGTITPQSLTVSTIGGVVADPTGVVYISDPTNNQVVKLTPGATTTTTVPFTGLNKPTQLALDGAGAVYVLDSGTSRILKVDAAGNQSVAFDVSTLPALTSLSAFTMDGATNLYVGGATSAGPSALYYVDTLGDQVLVAGNIGQPVALAVDFNGFVYSIDASGDLTRYDPAGNGTRLDIGFDQASTLAVDASGTVYVAGGLSNAGLKVVSPDGTETAYPTDGLPADNLANASAVVVIPDGSGSLVVGDSTGKQMFRILRGQPFGQQSVAVGDNFGTVALGSSKPIDGLLTNVGNEPTTSFALQSSLDDFSFASGSQLCVTSNDGSSLNSPLAAAGTCGLTLTFSPSYLGAHTAGFNFYQPSTGNIFLSLTASGNAVAATGPAPVLTPATMNFGNVPINTVSANQTATLTNTGTASLSLNGFSLSGTNLGGFSYTDNCGSSLAAGASCSIQINCLPVVVETLTASFNANFPSPIAQQSIALSCNAVATSTAPQAALTPATANFGSVTVGTTSSSQLFTLMNSGNAALSITSVSLGGANAAAFAIPTMTCGPTLAAGDSCSITITFSPTAAGNDSAVLNVVDAVGTQTSTLAGTGVAAASTAPQAALTPATADFGSVNVGSASPAQTFTLTNAGTAALPVTSVTLTGTNASAFTLGTNTCGSSLAAGASCTISITFNPTAAGSATASLSVVDSVGTQTSSLTGTGTAVATPDFSIAATPPAQSVAAGGAANYTVNITPAAGFDSAVTLTATGLPPGATVSFTPASVTPNGAAASSTMTIQTASTQTVSANTLRSWRYTVPALAAVLLFVPLRRLRRWRGMLCALLFSTTVIALSGCGGGFGLNKPVSATPYTVTVTGASGPLTHSTTVQITIQVAGE